MGRPGLSFTGRAWPVRARRSEAREPVSKFGGAVHAGGEGELVGRGGGEADDDDLVRGGGEDLAGVAGALVEEGGGGDGGVEVEFEAVVFDFAVGGQAHGGEVEVEIAEGLVAGHALRDGEHVRFGEGFRFGDLAGEEQLADAGDGGGGFGVVAIEAGLAVPDGLLVELDALERGVAEDHGSEAAVANGERVWPFGGGLGEVQQVRRRGRRLGEQQAAVGEGGGE